MELHGISKQSVGIRVVIFGHMSFRVSEMTTGIPTLKEYFTLQVEH